MKKWITGVLIVVGLQSGVAGAEDQTKKALAKAQFLLRQVTAEKSALQDQTADLQKQMVAMEEDYEAQLAKSQRRQDKLKEAIAAWKERSQQLKSSLTNTRSELRATTGERNNLTEELAIQTQNFNTCYEDNGLLAKVNRELLGQYQEKGAIDVISQNEPIFGLGKVEMENLIQDYSFQIDDADLSMNAHKIQSLDN